MDYLVHQGGSAHNNDISTHSQTINHIHLHQSAGGPEFDKWKREIGSLLQTGSAYSDIKPLLDLLVLILEPERIFLVPRSLPEKSELDDYREVIMIVDENKIDCDSVSSFIKVAGFKIQRTHIAVYSIKQMEDGLANRNFYFSSACREAFLIFSNSPYRLQPALPEYLQELVQDAKERFRTGIDNAGELLKIAASCSGKKQNPKLGAIVLRLALEQIYNAVNNSFGDENILPETLPGLMQKASRYLPQLSMSADQQTLELLDAARYSKVDIPRDADEESPLKDLQTAVEKLISAAKPAFENKIAVLGG